MHLGYSEFARHTHRVLFFISATIGITIGLVDPATPLTQGHGFHQQSSSNSYNGGKREEGTNGEQ
jgi:hypothetical protein